MLQKIKDFLAKIASATPHVHLNGVAAGHYVEFTFGREDTSLSLSFDLSTDWNTFDVEDEQTGLPVTVTVRSHVFRVELLIVKVELFISNEPLTIGTPDPTPENPA